MCDICKYITDYDSAINARLQMMAHDKHCPGQPEHRKGTQLMPEVARIQLPISLDDLDQQLNTIIDKHGDGLKVHQTDDQWIITKPVID